MIREIEAKTLVSHAKAPDPLFGIQYNLNLYRGCQHGCIYCDSRSECYQIENFDGEVLIKVNAIELLEKELRKKRVKGTVGTGSMNDPYMPVEENYRLTRRALEVILKLGFGVHINTKSSLIVRDADLLEQISRVHASVCFTITTADDELGKRLEPGAALVSERLKAMQILAERGIAVGTAMMPILPFIEDTPENITAILEQTAAHGGTFVLPALGVTLRNRQRDYFYKKLDLLYPGLSQKYARQFGERYSCHANNEAALWKVFEEQRQKYGLSNRPPIYYPVEKPGPEQLALF